jgi:hypothetical protein
MGNTCSTPWPMNLCLNSSRTSSQSEDENILSKNMSESATIRPSDKHTATVND